MKGEISSSIIEETNLIVLDVTSVNPRQAYLIIQSAIENYDTVSDYLFSNAVLKMVQEPTVPVSPSNVAELLQNSEVGDVGGCCRSWSPDCAGLFATVYSEDEDGCQEEFRRCHSGSPSL